MPFRHAHYWLLLLFPLTALAFWPSYFSDMRGASIAFHVHGLTASLWLALLALQSLSIHQRRNELHRRLGYASLALFPLFTVGGLMVMQTMGVKFAEGADPFYSVLAAKLNAIDAVSVVGVAYLYFMALKTRRKVHPHARYMLGTVFFLFSPIVSRLASVFPVFDIAGPDDFYRFGYRIHVATVLTMGLALVMYFRAPKHGRPMLEIATLIGLTSIVYEYVGPTAPWEAFTVAFGYVPTRVLVFVGLISSVAVAWLGWNAATTRRRAATAG